jgi:4-hydroxy-tetrahydrodipicolinate reductase
MAIRIVVAGATGWTGRALVAAILKSDDLLLVGAVARSASGKDAGEAIGLAPCGVTVSGTLAEALAVPSDVVIDYTDAHVVKDHVQVALAAGRHVVVGTAGLTAEDYSELDGVARANQRGLFAAGNFSITATLLKRFAVAAARYVPDVEVINYVPGSRPDTPSGTARELAEALAEVRTAATALPASEVSGAVAARGAAIGVGAGVQVHSVHLPSFVLACEAVFGAPDERLTIRHDAGASAAPYVAGTLLAARKVGEQVGLRRGLDMLID